MLAKKWANVAADAAAKALFQLPFVKERWRWQSSSYGSSLQNIMMNQNLVAPMHERSQGMSPLHLLMLLLLLRPVQASPVERHTDVLLCL